MPKREKKEVKLDKKVKKADTEMLTAYRPRGLLETHEGPDTMPASPTVKLKGIPAHPKRYTLAGNTITWHPPISIYCPVSIWDGDTKVWEWTAAGGEV